MKSIKGEGWTHGDGSEWGRLHVQWDENPEYSWCYHIEHSVDHFFPHQDPDWVY